MASEAKAEDESKTKVKLVDITGVNKVDLLRALCQNAKPSSFSFFSNPDIAFNEEAAKLILFGTRVKNEEKSTKDKIYYRIAVGKELVDRFIKYFNQRPIFCNLSKNQVDPTRYDAHIEAARKSKTKEKKVYHTFQEVVFGMDME